VEARQELEAEGRGDYLLIAEQVQARGLKSIRQHKIISVLSSRKAEARTFSYAIPNAAASTDANPPLPKSLLCHIVLRLPAVVMAFPGGLQTTVEVIRSVASDFST